MPEKIVIFQDRYLYSEFRRQIEINKRLNFLVVALATSLIAVTKFYEYRENKLKNNVDSEGEK